MKILLWKVCIIPALFISDITAYFVVFILDLQSVSDTSMTNQTSQKIYRIEEIPRDELFLTEDEALIPVAHFCKEIYNSFGVPFFIKAKRGEPYSALKERMQKKLNVPDKEWEKVGFFFFQIEIRIFCLLMICFVFSSTSLP